MDAILATALGLGALGVFALMIPESAGIPVPSEVVLLLAGVAVHEGHMTLWTAVLAGTAGNVVGSLVLYGVGRHLRGRALPRRARAGIARSERLFSRHGERAVLLGRLVPLARSFVSLPAGIARVPLARFTVLTAAGCAAWSVLFVGLGAALGSGAAAAGASAGPFAAAAVVLAAAVALVRGTMRRRGAGRSARDRVVPADAPT